MKSRELDEMEDLFEDFKKSINDFKGFLSDYKPQHIHKHSINDLNGLNELKKAISSVNIPDEVLTKQEITYSTDKVSHKFLWWYFAFSSIAITISVAAAVYFFNISEQARDLQKENSLLKIEEAKYRLLHNYMEQNAPNTTRRFDKEFLE